MPEDLLSTLNLLAEAIQIGCSQVDNHIGNVEKVSKDIKEVISGVKDCLVYLDAHGNKDDRVDSYKYDHVRPAFTPWVVARDKKSVLLLILYNQILALLLLLLLQVLNHHLNRRFAVGKLLGFCLRDDVLELLLLIFAELLQPQLLRIQLLLPVADLEHFVALLLNCLLMSLLKILYVL